MKLMLSFFLVLSLAYNLSGQGTFTTIPVFNIHPGNLFTENENKDYVTAPEWQDDAIVSDISLTSFRVTFHNFPKEARKAFLLAVSIWDQHIDSPVPIHIEARWEELEGNILAKGNPSIFYNNFSGAPIRNVYYPVALAEKFSGRDMNSGAPDIICRFNNRYNWYFEADGNTPSTHYDLLSSALHEITHGLGFSGFLNESEGKGFYNNNNGLPSIYDYFLFNDKDEQISDPTMFKSFSDELYRQMTSDNVKFCQTVSSADGQVMIDWIYAPPVWNDGTSMYHLKGYQYGEENGLMSPYAVKGKSNHAPGNITLAILSQLGWDIIATSSSEERLVGLER